MDISTMNPSLSCVTATSNNTKQSVDNFIVSLHSTEQERTMVRTCEENGCNRVDRYVSVSDLPKLQRAGHLEIELHYLKLHVKCYCKKAVQVVKPRHHHSKEPAPPTH
ncbi:hypothetical protein PG985_007560 [Apiospora marii]|uniref:Uncharacterized protein n=1 Tax=Apiospora marii TaxID=335849 RepID=A0ABR1SPJ5_9PEZI